MRYKLIKCDNAVNDIPAPRRILNAGLSRWVFRRAYNCFFYLTKLSPTKRQPMNKHPHEPGHNVLQMPSMPLENRSPARDFPGDVAAAGSPDDPRMREAMRLMEAFLAIEDAAARAALIALAERLVTHNWARRAQQR
jgi:hypothetical protein